MRNDQLLTNELWLFMHLFVLVILLADQGRMRRLAGHAKSSVWYMEAEDQRKTTILWLYMLLTIDWMWVIGGPL